MSIKSLRNTIFTAVAQCVTNKDVTDNLSELSKAFAEHPLKKEENLGLSVIVNAFDSISSTLENHPSLSLAMTVARGLTQAIAPELMGSMIEDIEYAKLQAFLKTPDPNQLNHDLNRLIKKSAIRAIGFIERLYLDKLKKEHGQNIVKDFLINPKHVEAFKNLCKNLKNELEKWLESNVIEDSVLEDASDCLQTLTDAIFETSEIDKTSEFATFFKQNLPFCFDLAVKEALKDKQSDKEFKAFQIWILENINEKNEAILQEIKALKNQKDTSSSAKFKQYLNKECEGLHLRFNELTKIVLEIQINLKENLEVSKENLEVSKQTQKDLHEIKENIKPTTPKHLTRPPLVPEVFRGRKDELTKIHTQLFEGENLLLLVNGEGGIGKTSLAAKYYQQYTTHYKHLAWVLCEQSIADALLQLAFPLKLQFEDTATSPQRLEILLTYMANMDSPCLLIIDNANEVEDLQQNYEHLRRCPNFHVLLTSRINDYRHAQFFKIESLSPEQALLVFREHYPKLQAQEEPIFEGIYDAVGGNTLVLELLAKNVAQQNSLKTKYQLADLLADLQTKGLLQIVEDDAVAVEYQSYRNAKPTEIIAAMYDLSKLSEAESRLLSIFAVLPAESIAYEILETLLTNTQDLDKTLLSLAQKGWLSHNTTDSSFKCSPVIQEIMIAKNQNIYADCEELIRVLIDKLKYGFGVGTLINTTYQESVMYARFADSVMNNVEAIEYNLSWLCERMGNFYKTHGNIEKGITYAKKDISISEKLVEQYPDDKDYKNKLAISYSKLGELQQSLGNLDKALEYFEQYNQLKNELYQDYPNQVDFKNGLAISYQYLGNLQRLFGNLDKALVFFEKYNQLENELYRDYPNQVSFKNGLAISYSKLGDLLQSLGNLDKALEYFEQYNQLENELYRDYPNQVEFKNGLAISYEKLGGLQQSLGNLDKALAYFEKDCQLSEELYRDYPNLVSFKNGLAISYSKLGELQQSLGNLDKALEYFEKLNQLENELYRDYPNQVSFKNGLAISYQYLGNLQKSLGNLYKALGYFEKYNQLENELYRDYPNQVDFKYGLASSYSHLGAFYKDINQKQKAKGYYEKCKTLLDELIQHFPKFVEFQDNLNEVKNALAGLGE
jgi:tetratricopeptide (TPR) repeat protein